MARVVRSRRHRRVVVSLVSGETFSGVLFLADKQVLLLRNAELNQVTENTPTPVDGELVVEWSKVAYVQVVGA